MALPIGWVCCQSKTLFVLCSLLLVSLAVKLSHVMHPNSFISLSWLLSNTAAKCEVSQINNKTTPWLAAASSSYASVQLLCWRDNFKLITTFLWVLSNLSTKYEVSRTETEILSYISLIDGLLWAPFLMLLRVVEMKIFYLSLAEDRPIKHLIQPSPGVFLCPAKQYSSYTIYGTVQCAGGRETSGAHLPADSPIRLRTTLSIAEIPRGCPSPCRCRDGETVMNYSRFGICFHDLKKKGKEKNSFTVCEWDDVHYLELSRHNNKRFWERLQRDSMHQSQMRWCFFSTLGPRHYFMIVIFRNSCQVK